MKIKPMLFQSRTAFKIENNVKKSVKKSIELNTFERVDYNLLISFKKCAIHINIFSNC